MARIIEHRLKELRFVGGRFDQTQGLLEFDVLPELLAYKQLLVETAKEQWRRRNPGRARLPRGFEENIRLAIHEVRDGSAVVPIERIVQVEDDALSLYTPDEVDEAAAIIDNTVRAASRDEPFPEGLPVRIISMFGEWGKSLGPDEGIELRSDGATEAARFDIGTRERILRRSQAPYEDRVELLGEVRAASLKTTDGGAFSIWLEDSTSIDGQFTPEQESIVTEALHNHRSVRVHLKGLAEFSSDGEIRRILRVDEIEERPLSEERFDGQVRPIWETVAEIGASVPEEEWDKIPSDASINLDHYLYGSKKARE